MKITVEQFEAFVGLQQLVGMTLDRGLNSQRDSLLLAKQLKEIENATMISPTTYSADDLILKFSK